MCRHEIKRTERIENKLAANVKSDNKSFYKYARSRQKRKDKVGLITDNRGRAIIKNEEVAEAINKYLGWSAKRKGVEPYR